MWPPLIDALAVSPGYEQAWAWRSAKISRFRPMPERPCIGATSGADPAALDLPGGLPRLSDFVTGSSALLRRLNQIGVAPGRSDRPRTCRAAEAGPAPGHPRGRHVALGRLHRRDRSGDRRRHAAAPAQPPERD
jgi:hypothetical protein